MKPSNIRTSLLFLTLAVTVLSTGCGSSPEGKYRDSSGTFNAEFSGGKAYIAMGAYAVDGTYKIQDNTLFLSYVDGRQLRKSFAAPAVEEGRQSFRWIAISNITLNEQHYESTH